MTQHRSKTTCTNLRTGICESLRTTLCGTACALSLLSTSLVADDATDWAQSRFGDDDMAGASNLMTPEKALEAAALMKTGTVISIGRVYEAEMPLFGSRAFALRGTSGLAGGPFGNNKVVWMDDFLATEIGQVGTQFDGLGHIGIGTDQGALFYNGVASNDLVGGTGLQKLGMEHVKPFFTRGVVLDIAAIRGAPMDAGDEITVADIESAMEAQEVGWGRHWITDNATFNSGAPGIGLEAAAWLIDKEVALIGSDTWPVEVVPNPDANLAFPVHQELLTKNGIFLHENVATERLIEWRRFDTANYEVMQSSRP